MLERPAFIKDGPATQARPRRRLRRPPRLRQPQPEIAALIADWPRLARDELADRIWQIQHLATRQHLPEHTWRIVDQMRRALRGTAPPPRTRRHLKSNRETRNIEQRK